MSGNLCFETLLPYKVIITLLFIFLAYKVFREESINIKHLSIIITWLFILLLPGIYTINYSISSTLHAFLKISIGILTILYCKQHFCNYYVNIIFFLAIISLICFAYNNFVGILPFIPVDSTNLDNGNIYRVSSILYTQLYNPISGSFNLRNCGPFWEPGAFQGFLNLALFINILYNKHDKYWMLQNIIFIVTIITTYSTGGYIALFTILLYQVFFSAKWHPITKIIVTIFFISICIHFYNSLDFLGEKIVADDSRTGISASDFSSGAHLVFGYGYDVASFKNSKIQTASSIINLIRYSGIIGLILYYLPALTRIRSIKDILFIIIISTILFNEPFLTAGPFWWGIPLCLSLFTKKNKKFILKHSYTKT